MANPADTNGPGTAWSAYSIGRSVRARLLPTGNWSTYNIVQRANRFIWLAPGEGFTIDSAVEVCSNSSTLLAVVDSIVQAGCGTVVGIRVEHGFHTAEDEAAAGIQIAAAAAAGAGAVHTTRAVDRPSGLAAVRGRVQDNALEKNKRLVRRLIEEVWNGRNMAAVDEIIHHEHVNHDPASPDLGVGPAAYRDLVNLFAIAPGIRFSIEDSIAQSDRVATRWKVTSAYHVSLGGITVHRISDGKIIESWGNWDALGLMNSMKGIH